MRTLSRGIGRIPEGNYNGYRLASVIQDLLNDLESNFTFELIYNTATGAIKIEETTEGQINTFDIASDYGITYWENETNGVYPWKNNDNIIYTDINNA